MTLEDGRHTELRCRLQQKKTSGDTQVPQHASWCTTDDRHGREIFDLAQREPVKALDLSFNLLSKSFTYPVKYLGDDKGEQLEQRLRTSEDT